MTEFFAVIGLIIKFFDIVTLFVKKLEKTPTEKVGEILQSMNEAFDKANKTDDTSNIEDVLSGS
jgi:hypothetical protein